MPTESALCLLDVIGVTGIAAIVLSHGSTGELVKFALACKKIWVQLQGVAQWCINHAVVNTFDLSNPRVLVRALGICCKQCPTTYPWDVVEFIATELDKHKLFLCPVKKCQYAFDSYDAMIRHLLGQHSRGSYDTSEARIDSATMMVDGNFRRSKLLSSRFLDTVFSVTVGNDDTTSHVSKMQLMLKLRLEEEDVKGCREIDDYSMLNGRLEEEGMKGCYTFDDYEPLPAIFWSANKIFEEPSTMCQLCSARYPTMKCCELCDTWLPDVMFLSLDEVHRICGDLSVEVSLASLRRLRSMQDWEVEDHAKQCRYCMYAHGERHPLYEFLTLHESKHKEELAPFPDYSTNYAYWRGDTAYTFEGKVIGKRDPNYNPNSMETDDDPFPMDHTVVVTPAGKRHVLMDQFVQCEGIANDCEKEGAHRQYYMYECDTEQTHQCVVKCALLRAAYQSRLDNAGCE